LFSSSQEGATRQIAPRSEVIVGREIFDVQWGSSIERRRCNKKSGGAKERQVLNRLLESSESRKLSRNKNINGLVEEKLQGASGWRASKSDETKFGAQFRLRK
jgi:hypothetical protein